MENDKWLKIANLCAELVSDDEVVIRSDSSALGIINECLGAWGSRLCEDIHLLDGFSFVVTQLEEDFLSDFECRGNNTTNDESFWHFAIRSTETWNCFTVDQKLLELESLVPGLGRSAIVALENAGFYTMRVITPYVGEDIARSVLWMGEETDEDVKAALGQTGDDFEDMLLPSKYRNSFPSLFFSGEHLTVGELKKITPCSEWVGEVIKEILCIMHLIDEGASLPSMNPDNETPLGFSCFLGSRGDNNHLIQVLDEEFNYANSGDGFTMIYGVNKVPFDREAFLEWVAHMEKGFSLYAALDRLVSLVGVEYQQEE
jgi:PRTRC genetic system protein F